jgi:hypothetical protein
MADRPVYPSVLDPKGWEKNKGLLAKATIKADVKGSLEKAAKLYWEAVPWEPLTEWESSDEQATNAAAAKARTLCEALNVVHANATAGVAAIDKIPGNKITMKASRLYLSTMADAAQKLETAVRNFANAAVAGHAGTKAAEQLAATSFGGWIDLKVGKVAELVKECVMRSEATAKSMAMAKDATRKADIKDQEMLKVTSSQQSLKDLYDGADTRYQKLDNGGKATFKKKYDDFKAKKAGNLKLVQDAIDKVP